MSISERVNKACASYPHLEVAKIVFLLITINEGMNFLKVKSDLEYSKLVNEYREVLRSDENYYDAMDTVFLKYPNIVKIECYNLAKYEYDCLLDWNINNELLHYFFKCYYLHNPTNYEQDNRAYSDQRFRLIYSSKYRLKVTSPYINHKKEMIIKDSTSNKNMAQILSYFRKDLITDNENLDNHIEEESLGTNNKTVKSNNYANTKIAKGHKWEKDNCFLKELFRLLKKDELIDNKVIYSNFSLLFMDTENTEFNKIEWKKSDPLLCYLIDELGNHGYIKDETLWVRTSNIFSGYTNKKLSSKHSKLLLNKGNGKDSAAGKPSG